MAHSFSLSLAFSLKNPKILSTFLAIAQLSSDHNSLSLSLQVKLHLQLPWWAFQVMFEQMCYIVDLLV